MTDFEGLIGREVAGFRITKLLGEGGMAVVFRGENLLNPRLLRALKIVRPELAGRAEFRGRFAEEAITLESLHHPNIVRFHGMRHERGALIMELELLDPGTEGGPLSSVIRKNARPPALRDAVFWIQQAAAGVAVAHEHGVVHRDLKPENIFLHTAHDGKMVVKVLDFGIAKAIDDADRASKLTTAGTVPGTVAYMPPEVCKGGMPGKEADVYALGVSLYEALLGYHPYAPPGTFKSSNQMMFAHTSEPLPDVRRVRPDVPPQLVEVLQRATNKDPTQRYADASAFAAALSSVLPMLAGGHAPRELHTQFGVPTLASPITPTTPTATPTPTQTTSTLPWLLGGAAVLLVAAVGGWASIQRAATGEPPPNPATTDDTTDDVPVAQIVTTPVEQAPLNAWVSIAPATPTARRVYDSYSGGYRQVESLPLLGLARDRTDQRGFWPRRGITAPAQGFSIQAHEVTWAELDPFLATLSDAERATLVTLPWLPAEPARRARLPATGIPWDIARRYCVSLGGGGTLPTEEQWEWAARGRDLRPNPWGTGRIDLDRTNAFQGAAGQVAEVATHDQDRTPDGLYDMAGNAMEWTVDLFREDDPDQDESWVQTADASFRGVRGLPLTQPAPRSVPEASLAYRDAICATGTCDPDTAEFLAHVGFRCVR